MTDTELKKALKICGSNDSKRLCNDCPLNSYTAACITILMRESLDLINRLEEKNSNLTSDLTSLQNDLTSAKAEIERLKNHIQEGIDLAKQLPEMVALVRAEAYKEIIEKVKPIIGEIVERMFDDNESNCVIHDCVKPSKIACNSEICIQENKQAWEGRLDNLLKELEVDANG